MASLTPFGLRTIRLGVLLVLVTALAACSSDNSESGSQERMPTGKPAQANGSRLAGESLYVAPDGPAARQAREWRRAGRAQEASLVASIAAKPTALWIADDNQVASRVRARTTQAAEAGKTALLVAYYVPGRDCGSYSAGGAPSAAAYRAWVRAFARGIGDRRAVVILEPDALAQSISCLPKRKRAERYALLRFATRSLAAGSRVSVYIDAGNPGWIRPSSRMAGPLRRSGIRHAAGFALNVSNFYRTSSATRYGGELSRRLSGAHFVVDTSRNGNGPSRADDPGGPKWCNPPGRAVGRAPSTRTGAELVDAYLWVKTPGESDGSCRPGAPAAGQWWPEYALSLLR